MHSGAFDPFEACIAAAHDAGAWVHVDGAFGLFAAASPTRRHLVAGLDAADSWATDAHKTLNVPYDCGLAIVRDRAALRAAMGMHGDYLIHDAAGEPFDKVPEISRRGRAFPVWAVLRSLGRDGVGAMVDGFCDHARTFADGIAAIEGAEVLNDVEFTQVCASFGDDDRTRAVVDGDAGRRYGVDDRLAVARTRRPPRQRQQLVDDHGRRGGQPRRAAACSRSIGSVHAHLSVQHGRRAAVRRRDG